MVLSVWNTWQCVLNSSLRIICLSIKLLMQLIVYALQFHGLTSNVSSNFIRNIFREYFLGY